METPLSHHLPLHAGSGRYIPGSGPSPGAPAGVADPFTGKAPQRGGGGAPGCRDLDQD